MRHAVIGLPARAVEVSGMGSMLREGMETDEFARLLGRAIVREGVPFSGSIDLTTRCNLRCTHCYLGDRRAAPPDRELDTARLLSLVDEMAGAGCLWLLFTGGEPLLRPDFPDIYRHVVSRGMIPSLFTNGTLIDGEFVRLVSDLPHRNLEISLYGATARTYEAVTGIPGSHAACMEGIDLLAGAGLPFRLKTMLLDANRHEIAAMRRIADGYGVPFRMDACLFPTLDGDRSPLAQRVPPDDAVAMEFSDPSVPRRWADFLGAHPLPAPTDSLYTCGAGRRGFHIKADGTLVPCVMFAHLGQPLAGGDFLPAWHRLRAEMASKVAGARYGCRECEDRLLCGICPAFFLLETGSEEIRSDYLCAVGRRRARMLRTCDHTGGFEHAVE